MNKYEINIINNIGLFREINEDNFDINNNKFAKEAYKNKKRQIDESLKKLIYTIIQCSGEI